MFYFCLCQNKLLFQSVFFFFSLFLNCCMHPCTSPPSGSGLHQGRFAVLENINKGFTIYLKRDESQMQENCHSDFYTVVLHHLKSIIRREGLMFLCLHFILLFKFLIFTVFCKSISPQQIEKQTTQPCNTESSRSRYSAINARLKKVTKTENTKPACQEVKCKRPGCSPSPQPRHRAPQDANTQPSVP